MERTKKYDGEYKALDPVQDEVKKLEEADFWKKERDFSRWEAENNYHFSRLDDRFIEMDLYNTDHNFVKRFAQMKRYWFNQKLDIAEAVRLLQKDRTAKKDYEIFAFINQYGNIQIPDTYYINEYSQKEKIKKDLQIKDFLLQNKPIFEKLTHIVNFYPVSFIAKKVLELNIKPEIFVDFVRSLELEKMELEDFIEKLTGHKIKEKPIFAEKKEEQPIDDDELPF